MVEVWLSDYDYNILQPYNIQYYSYYKKIFIIFQVTKKI